MTSNAFLVLILCADCSILFVLGSEQSHYGPETLVSFCLARGDDCTIRMDDCCKPLACVCHFPELCRCESAIQQTSRQKPESDVHGPNQSKPDKCNVDKAKGTEHVQRSNNPLPRPFDGISAKAVKTNEILRPNYKPKINYNIRSQVNYNIRSQVNYKPEFYWYCVMWKHECAEWRMSEDCCTGLTCQCQGQGNYRCYCLP